MSVRIEERRGDQSLQDYVLAAIRAAVYGSSTEVALRTEVAHLHATVRALGGAYGAPGTNVTAPAPRPEEDVRKGW
jgi:hypothetical protein